MSATEPTDDEIRRYLASIQIGGVPSYTDAQMNNNWVWVRRTKPRPLGGWSIWCRCQFRYWLSGDRIFDQCEHFPVQKLIYDLLNGKEEP